MRMRAVLGVAPHTGPVVLDQVDAREVVRTEEGKFVEVTETLANFTVNALTWGGQAFEAKTLCTSLLDFPCW